MNAMPKKGEWGGALVRIMVIVVAGLLLAGSTGAVSWKQAVDQDRADFKTHIVLMESAVCRIEKRQERQPTSDCDRRRQ